MARRRGGIFHTIGNLIRWAIWALAALFVVAVVLYWNKSQEVAETGDGGTMPAAEAPAAGTETAVGTGQAAEPGATVDEGGPVEDSTEQAAMEEGGAEAGTMAEPNAAQAGGADVQQGTGTEQARPVEGAATVDATGAETGPGAAPAPDAGGTASDTASTGQDNTVVAPNPAESGGAMTPEGSGTTAPRAVEGATASPGGMAPVVLPAIPGDDATYSLTGILRLAEGGLDVTVDRTLDGVAATTIYRITCLPPGIGVVAEGDGPRNETPAMETPAPGKAVAVIAAAACAAN